MGKSLFDWKLKIRPGRVVESPGWYQKDLNARKPRGILGLLFLFRSSDKVGRKTRVSQNWQAFPECPYGVQMGRASVHASQILPYIPDHGKTSQSLPDGAEKQTSPGCLANDLTKPAGTGKTSQGWRGTSGNPRTSKNPRRPEDQKMVLTVSNTIRFLNRSPLLENT